VLIKKEKYLIVEAGNSEEEGPNGSLIDERICSNQEHIK